MHAFVFDELHEGECEKGIKEGSEAFSLMPFVFIVHDDIERASRQPRNPEFGIVTLSYCLANG